MQSLREPGSNCIELESGLTGAVRSNDIYRRIDRIDRIDRIVNCKIERIDQMKIMEFFDVVLHEIQVISYQSRSCAFE